MSNIDLIDVSMRDGNQSLWGATGLNSSQMLQIAGELDRVGFRAVDFTSSSHMAVAVRYFGENPWERIRRVHAAMPRTPLQYITTGMRFISWEQADPEFMRLVYRKLHAAGIGRFALMDPMNDPDALIAGAKLIKQEGEAEVMAALTFTLSKFHDDEYYAKLAARLSQSPDIDLLYLKDPSGLMSADRARTLVPAVKQAIGHKTLEVHLQCTIGLGEQASIEAAVVGADGVHVGIGPLGNGSSLPEAQRMLLNLKEIGHTLNIDETALKNVANYWERLAQSEGLPIGKPQEFDARFLNHQIAGGVLTTMRRQLAEVKLEHKLPELIEEASLVRADLGYPIMVTPFPQMVCSQALFNVISGKRYSQVSDQVINYILGRFGRATNPVDSDVKNAILDRPRAREIEKEPIFVSLDELRSRFPRNLSDEEFLLRAVMPQDQVDTMLANKPFRSSYSPDCAPIIELLKKLQNKPDISNLVVERAGFRLALHSGSSVK